MTCMSFKVDYEHLKELSDKTIEWEKVLSVQVDGCKGFATSKKGLVN